MKSSLVYAAAALSLVSSVVAVPQTSLGNFKIPRNRVCNVGSFNNGSDDTSFILSAVNSCNPGGKVVFLANTSYTVGTAMNLTYLDHIDLQVLGNITFTNNTDYWQKNGFYQTFQNATTFFQIGGNDVNFYGPGIIDGNGQVWWDLYAQNIYILRPVLVGIVGLKSSVIGPLTLRNSPQYYHWVANSSNVLFTGIDIAGASKSVNTAKNTDGWDTYRSDSITIQNSTINNGDDCVSFKPNSTNMVVQNLICNGSHGISVGSLGQYKGEYDIVENILVRNISMSNAQNGARIKVWPGVPSALSGDLQGGGGTGRVNNITFDGFYNYNNDYTIMLTQCYGQSNLTLCNQFPSSLTISNIKFNNFTGTSSTKYQPVSGYIVCSSPGVCNNITATNINVSSPKNVTDYFSCANVDTTKLAVSCH